MKKITFIIIFLTSILSIAFAQGQKQSLNVRSILIGNGAEGLNVFAIANGHAEPLEVRADLSSKYQKLDIADGKLHLLKSASSSSSADNVLATASVPANATSIFLFLLAIPEADTCKYAALAVDDSFSKFPLGTFKIINVTSNDLGFNSGEMKKQLTPGSITDLVLPTDEAGFSRVTFYSKLGDIWEAAYSRTIISKKTERYFCFITPHQNKKNSVFKLILDNNSVVTDSKK